MLRLGAKGTIFRARPDRCSGFSLLETSRIALLTLLYLSKINNWPRNPCRSCATMVRVVIPDLRQPEPPPLGRVRYPLIQVIGG